MLAKRLLSAYLVSTVIVGTACAEDTATLNAQSTPEWGGSNYKEAILTRNPWGKSTTTIRFPSKSMFFSSFDPNRARQSQQGRSNELERVIISRVSLN
ncbi:hypothetical protein HFO61_30870 [Rhizobium leguminosarum]|uniref:hypothetical protein n=1 Tax=Rhizobium leguminosarum TaxID=384 RepID=UPI001C9475BA|nr:hypothetical protein [Rhizobium leguminosarum]MBY5551148.1 hypothetical protein [Rhizobium leguminosarum]MBY5645298.1 hypothetical protein [Rhizobium leguminosarum]